VFVINGHLSPQLPAPGKNATVEAAVDRLDIVHRLRRLHAFLQGQIALQVCHNAIISSRVSYEKDPHGATTDSCSEPQPPELEDGEELGQASEVA
jgi:hypothetical protein